MAIRYDHAEFGLDCWLSADDPNEPASEFSDNADELRARVPIIFKAGRYRYLELQRWNPNLDDWEVLEVFETP